MSYLMGWGYFDVSWPKDTPVDEEWLRLLNPAEMGDTLYLFREFHDTPLQGAVDRLVGMFRKPLDEVEGLELHCSFSCIDDQYYEYHLDILEGEVMYEESRLTFERRPPCMCPIDIGR